MAKSSRLKSCIARDRILGWIREGRLAPGQRMPAEPALARMLNLHHTTVRRGLAELQQRGLIEKRARVGNFVTGGTPTPAANQVAVVLRKWDSKEWPHRAFAGLTMAELDDAIDRQSHSVTMLTYHDHLFDGPNSAGSAILANGIKGILLYADDRPEWLPAVCRLLDAGVKVVLLNHATTWDKLGLFSVKYDEAGALRQIFDKLVGLGHRRIAVALDPAWVPAFHDMYRGCVESLFQEYRLGPLDDLSFSYRWDPVACERDSTCIEPLFDQERRPTAVVVPDETHAMGVLSYCYRRSIRIPDELSLTAVQNFSPHSHPIPVSSPASDVLVGQGTRAAAEHLLALLAGQRPTQREISLRCDIRWTESVGPGPAAT